MLSIGPLRNRALYAREYRKRNTEKFREYWRQRRLKEKSKKPPKAKKGDTCAWGREYELLALSLLKGSVDRNEVHPHRKGWDIDWNGLKVEVKVRNKLPRWNWWSFVIRPNEADYYLCFCVDNTQIKSVLFVPSSKMGSYFPWKEGGHKNDQYLLSISSS